jgi:hypothetical protein
VSASLEADRINTEKMLEAVRQSQHDYHVNLQGIGDDVHPFSVVDSSVNDAEKVLQLLEGGALAFKALAEKQYITDKNYKKITQPV